MAIGRISGPLLKSNLIRDGVDLAFETDLLYLDVNNSRIGVNTSSPQYSLDVVGSAKTTTLKVDNQFTIGNFTVSGNTIASTAQTINFTTVGADVTAYHSRLLVNDIELNGNTISTVATNQNLELRPSGTGIVDIQSSARVTGTLTVDGNITATGDIRIDGNLVIGNAITDSITINASIRSSLIPETNATYDLGSASYNWRNVYAQTITADTLALTAFNVGNLIFTDNQITTTPGQNLILDANAAGSVVLGHYAVRDNVITNFVNDSISTFRQTGTGYVKFEGTNAFVPPVGPTSDRPTAYAVEGMTRYNTDSKSLEIWDGLQWSSPAGSIGAVSEGTATDIAARFALILG